MTACSMVTDLSLRTGRPAPALRPLSMLLPKHSPSHPMPLPGTPAPGEQDTPTHQPIDPDDGAPAAPIPPDQTDADWLPAP